MDKLDVPGYSWAIVRNGNQADAGWSGWARGPNDAKPRTMDENTKFISGSMAKSICAVAVMQLIEKNEIRLNDVFYPLVSSIYPNINAPDTVKQLTIFQLLTHSTNFNYWADSGDTNDLERLYAKIKKELESSLPGISSSHYANVNYIFLAKVVESVTGQSLIDYVEKNIVKILNEYKPHTRLTNKEENNPCLYYLGNENSGGHGLGDIPPDWQGATGSMHLRLTG